jgi:hypothetical protein
LIVATIGASLCACTAADSPPPATDAEVLLENPLYVSPESYDFSANPELLERVTASPYGYFRLINIPFARAVCREFEAELEALPSVNLHGDAHLEQYAITDEGYGLADFDDACSGPAVLDLVRFSTSILLVCETRGWHESAHRILGSFLDGYEFALREPDALASVPEMVESTMRRFPRSRTDFLDWVEGILEPIDEKEWGALSASFARYVRDMHERNPRIAPGYFEIREAGRIRLGVGSALDRKYLFRVEGATKTRDDDIVLEIKEVRDLSAIPCVKGGEGRGAFRILLGYSRIGTVPYDLIAPLPRVEAEGLDDAEFWVHAWQAHYEEIDVADPTFTVEDCVQIAEATGMQLGTGHVREIGDPHTAQLRRMQLTLAQRLRNEIVAVSMRMAESTLQAWTEFRSQALARDGF